MRSAALLVLVAAAAWATAGGPAAPSPTPVAAAAAAPPTVGARFNPARHYGLAAAPDFWLKGDAPLRRNDGGLRQRLIAARDTEVAVQGAAYEARPFDRQPTVAIVFAVGDRPVQAFVYRPNEGRVYVTEDGIAFPPPPALAAELDRVIIRPTPAGAQVACGFTLGFAALHARIPAVAGDCLEDERHDPATGDALQRTTGGLLVWRKADNHTGFTDGSHTWVDGPFGLQERLNAERFDWEVTVGRAEALARVREAPPGSREGFLRIDTREAKLTTWAEWDRASNPGGCTVVPDRADLYWVVLVRGQIGWASIAASGVAPSGGLVVDAATGMVRSFFSGARDDAFARLVDRDPGAASGRIASRDDVPPCAVPLPRAPLPGGQSAPPG